MFTSQHFQYLLGRWINLKRLRKKDWTTAVTLTQTQINQRHHQFQRNTYYPVSLFKYDYPVYREKIYFRYINTFQCIFSNYNFFPVNYVIPANLINTFWRYVSAC